MKKMLVVYATKSGKTMVIGEHITNGARAAGIEVEFLKASSITDDINLKDYDAFVFGSTTETGSMLPEMKSTLKIVEKSSLKGKAGGAFGTFGCSGQGPMQIYDTMKIRLNMDMMGSEPLILESSTPVEMIKLGKNYGKKFAAYLAARGK